MTSENLKIVTLKDLLQDNLTIPNYQRPYRWTTESASVLFNDIYGSFVNKNEEYRIGSVVLHHDKDFFYIVDGQQRLTTISILIYCFYAKTKNPKYENLSRLLTAEKSFNELSTEAIVNNYKLFEKKFSDLQESERDAFIEYALNRCSFVKIITDNEQEAFQFFDSQNSRGKALAPHDLLKSYHLREMNNETETEKISIVENWESLNQKKLALFFANNLYPLVRYYKNTGGLYYSSKKIKTFKGISKQNKYNFSIYHKAANLYIEHFNSERISELVSYEKMNQFQLTQPLIAGKRFFQYTQHYYSLYKEIISRIESEFKENEISNSGSGNQYIRNLFVNVLIFFVDRFDFYSLTKQRLYFFYKWAYSLRIVMHSVYPETINKYALGNHDRINKGVNIFKIIAEIQTPEELDSVVLNTVTEQNVNDFKASSYMQIWEKLFGEKK